MSRRAVGTYTVLPSCPILQSLMLFASIVNVFLKTLSKRQSPTQRQTRHHARFRYILKQSSSFIQPQMKTSAKYARGIFKKEKTICGLFVICAHASTTGNAWDTNGGQARSKGFHVFVPGLGNFISLYRVERELQKGQCSLQLFSTCITVHGNLTFRSYFLQWYHISNSNQLRATLGAAMPDSIVSCRLSPSQIKKMMMQKWGKKCCKF